MAAIRIVRTNEYLNKLADYVIFIDGEKVGTLANGETREFATTDGRHMVNAKIDWCSSPEVIVEVSNGETVCLKVGGFKYGQFLMRIGRIFIVLDLVLMIFFDFYWLNIFAVPVLFLLLYYVTWGRKKYLQLEKLSNSGCR